MNSFERYCGMVKGDKVDFVPRIPILMHFAARYSGKKYSQYASDYRVMADCKCKLVEDFDFEQLDVMCDPWRETTAFGGKIKYFEDSVPSCSHPLENTRNLDLLAPPDPDSSQRMNDAIKAIGLYKAFGWKKYSITGWVEGPAAMSANLRGVAGFMLDLMDDEAYTCQLMDICTEVAIKFAVSQIAAGADTIGVGDAIASQISPDLYERLVAPREKRLFEAIHNAGGFVRLHICGNINKLLGSISNLGIDIIDCDWMVDMEAARRILGTRVALAGNLDPVKSVMNSDPQTIKSQIMEIYKKVDNPFFVNAGCEIPVGTPHENLRALCESVLAM